MSAFIEAQKLATKLRNLEKAHAKNVANLNDRYHARVAELVKAASPEVLTLLAAARKADADKANGNGHDAIDPDAEQEPVPAVPEALPEIGGVEVNRETGKARRV